MNKDSIIGFVLIGALFIGYALYMQPSQEEIEALQHKQDSIAKVEQQKQLEIKNNVDLQKKKTTITAKIDTSKETISTNDSIQNIKSVENFGIFSSASQGKEKTFTLENNLIKVILSNKGGVPVSVELKKYKTFDQKPVLLFKKDSAKLALTFFSQNRALSTYDMYFKLIEGAENIDTNKTQKTTLRLQATENKYIDFTYTLRHNSYNLDFDIKVVGLEKELASNQSYLNLDWDLYMPQQEKTEKNENQYSQLSYKYLDAETDYLSPTSEKEENLTTKVRWIAYKDQFFSSILIAKQAFANAQIKSAPVYETIPGYIKHFHSSISIPYQSNVAFPMQFYFGPNDYYTLSDYSKQDYLTKDQDLQLNVLVDLGWAIFRWVNKFVIIPIFFFLNKFISSYGIIILLLTIIIKLALFPLTYKSYMSSAKMKVLKPQLDKINEKIPKEKAMERQQATMALYKKAGVNPMGGCLPMLLQMPILFAMFKFFPTAIQLRQQSFLWATDLSSYDSIYSWSEHIPILSTFYGNHISLFTLLMTGSTLLYTKMQNSMNPQSNTMPGMKTMMYMMPIMFLFFLNNYSSGLTYYYFIANMFTFGQMYLIKQFVDDKKVLAKLESAKKRPTKKKSGFQARLEKMAKERQKQVKRK